MLTAKPNLVDSGNLYPLVVCSVQAAFAVRGGVEYYVAYGTTRWYVFPVLTT